MRRFASALLTLLVATALSGCNNGYGGTAIGSGGSAPDTVLFTTGSGYQSFFKVAPSGTTPLVITAVGTKSHFDIVQPGTTFTWSVVYGTPANMVQIVNATTGITSTVPCAAVAPTANPPGGALFVQTVASGTSPGGNVAYAPPATTNSIAVLPSALGTPAVTAPVGSGTAAAPVYCLVLTATADNGVSANATVLVSN